MKKTLLSTLLLSSIIIGGSTVAAAATVDNAETGVEVELSGGGHKPEPGPYKNKLAIIRTPKPLIFKGTVDADQVVLNNTPTIASDKETQYIVVNDNRETADVTPWTLTGQLSELAGKDKTGADIDLGAAQLEFQNAGILAYNIGEKEVIQQGADGTDYIDIDPAPVPTGNDSVAADPTVYSYLGNATSTKMIAGGSAVPVFKATAAANKDNSKARGAYTNIGDSKLSIAKGNATNEANYSGTIYWTLSDN